MQRTKAGSLIWIAVILLFMNGGLLETVFSSFGGSQSQTSYDYYMDTTDYQVDIQVEEDNSYTVTENLQVNFQDERHGIYRYIPLTGSSVFRTEDGSVEKIPYRAVLSDISASTAISVYEENGNAVFRLGSGDSYVYGPNSYTIRYNLRPGFQKKDYANVYYNIFPMQWGTDIPAGSSFRITFPKEVDASKLQFYYGPYGAVYDGEDILDCTVDGKVVTGTLTDSLTVGNGLTVFADVGEGYFSSVLQVPHTTVMPVAVSAAVLLIVAVLFLLFGRDEPIIPSIQYQPPDNLDSGAVGYIVDGVVEDRDVISMIIYWADKGYLAIHEDEEGELSFERKSPLSADAPQYQKLVFNKLFAKGDYVTLGSLQYRFADTIAAAKSAIRDSYAGSRGIYTGRSRAARGITLLLCGIPLLSFLQTLGAYAYMGGARMMFGVCLIVFLYVGAAVFCRGVDTWYGKASVSRRAMVAAGVGTSFTALALFAGSYLLRVFRGEIFFFLPDLIAVVAATSVSVVLTGFMRKRTHQCIEWMGRLVGLRDFIETAELDRMKVLAQENPEWFYHIIPYAYVFGLSDVFARRLSGLQLTPPAWYTTQRDYGYDYFDYYLFHHIFMGNVAQISHTLTMPRPPAPVSHSGSSFGGGGGFSGGSFGGGGGFSGGGFGGGGGGSW